MWVEKGVITFEEWPTFEDRPAGNESVAWLKTGKRKVVTGADYSNSSMPIGDIIKDAFAFVKLVNSNFDGTKFLGVANFSGSTFSNGNTFDNALFFNKTDFTGARFASDALFSKATFYREVVFDTTKFDGRALFKGAVFSSSEQQLQFKDALFCTGADFCNAEFAGGALFNEGVTFSSDVSFSNAKFKGNAAFDATFSNADFSNAEFEENAYFSRGGAFSGDVSFGGVKFKGEIEFSMKFLQKVSFSNAKFIGEDAAFAFCEFPADTSFDGAEFSGDAVFADTKFLAQATFVNARIAGDAVFMGSTFSKNSMSSMEKAQISGNFVCTETDLGDTDFSYVKVGGIFAVNSRTDLGKVRNIETVEMKFSNSETFCKFKEAVITAASAKTVSFDTSGDKPLGVELMCNPATGKGVVIKAVVKGHEKELSGEIAVGQVIIEINGKDVTGIDSPTALAIIMKNTAAIVRFTLADDGHTTPNDDDTVSRSAACSLCCSCCCSTDTDEIASYGEIASLPFNKSYFIRKEIYHINVDASKMAKDKGEIEFTLEALKELKAFQITKDNWNVFIANVGALYDFLGSLIINGGHPKLIDVLKRVIFDDQPAVSDIKGFQWLTPRRTFLAVMAIKDGFSKSPPSPGALVALDVGIKTPFRRTVEFMEEMNELKQELVYIAAITVSKERIGLLMQQVSLSLLFGISSILATYIYDSIDDSIDWIGNSNSTGTDDELRTSGATLEVLQTISDSQQQQLDFQQEEMKMLQSNQQEMIQLLTTVAALLNATANGK